MSSRLRFPIWKNSVLTMILYHPFPTPSLVCFVWFFSSSCFILAGAMSAQTEDHIKQFLYSGLNWDDFLLLNINAHHPHSNIHLRGYERLPYIWPRANVFINPINFWTMAKVCGGGELDANICMLCSCMQSYDWWYRLNAIKWIFDIFFSVHPKLLIKSAIPLASYAFEWVVRLGV